MAYLLACDMSVNVDEVIWKMPYVQVFKLLGIVQRVKSENTNMNRVDRLIQRTILTELKEGQTNA